MINIQHNHDTLDILSKTQPYHKTRMRIIKPIKLL